MENNEKCFWKQPATNCSVAVVAIIASVLSALSTTILVFGVMFAL